MSRELTINPANGARDIRLIERAVRKKWLMPDELFTVLPKELAKMFLDKANTSERGRLSAAKTLVQMNGQNNQEEKDSGQHLHLHQHVEGAGVDYSKIPTDKLEAIEKELLELANGTTEDRGGTAQTRSVPLHEIGLAAD